MVKAKSFPATCVYMQILPNPQFLSVFKTLYTAPLTFLGVHFRVLTNPLSPKNNTTINMQNNPSPNLRDTAFKFSVVIVTL